MPPKLTVSQNVIDRLSQVKELCSGNLYGVLYKNALFIIGFYKHDEQKTDILHSLPTEVDLHGIVEVHDGLINEEKVKQTICDVDVTDTPIYISCKIATGDNILQAYYTVNNRLEKVSYEVISESNIYSQFLHVRLMVQLPFSSEFATGSIKDGFALLRKQLAHGQVVFNFPKTSVYIMGSDNENTLIGLTGDPSVGEICKQSTEASEGCAPSYKKKKESSLQIDVLRVVMFKKITRDSTLDNLKLHAPIVHVDKRNYKSLTLTINIDALSIVHRESKVVELYSVLVESCCRYLRSLEHQFLKKFNACEGNYKNISEMETFHFFPETCGHFVTKTFFKNESDADLKDDRKILHIKLLLPLNRPFFKRANRFVFKGDVQGGGPLVNVHEEINATDNGGEIVLVTGKYSYYHYCQNNMDDNGWGCAYRSLQTLASWFRWQGYTDKLVPTFHDIQKCLVDIGDKTPNFVGSKQWIGSTEVHFVLNTLMDVTCKILYVSSGEDMGSKGPDLVNHFKVNGSPVMIGGGVLAHTILGVDYNNITGDVKFLILDPHYTGPEDLTTIQKKGWCGWKGVNFWDKTAYYNMCLPQVPQCI